MEYVKKCVFFILVGFLFACKQGEKVPLIPVNDFFKSLDRATYRVSPDGKSLSYLKLQDKKHNLFVEDIATGQVTQLTRLQEKNISFYSWVSNDHLIYYKEKDGNRKDSELFIINKEGKNERQLANNERSRVRILEDQLIDDKYLLVLSNKRDSTVSDVYRLNVQNGAMEMAARNPGNITNWVTDAKGKLRMAISSDGVNETLWYREDETQELRPMLTNNFKTSIIPVAFSGEDPNSIYVISDVERDKKALVELDCKTGKEKRVLFANDTLNVVDAQYSRSKGKMAYVVYETWKKQKHYLDEEARELYQGIDLLLPNTETRIIDRDKNDNVFVIRTFTDRSPGSYYLYHASTGSMKKLSDINASINEAHMGKMKPIKYQTSDGLEINGYLTLPVNAREKKLPLIVLPHNGPGQRNSWGYNAEVQFFVNRGYAVFQANYRGSSGYGKEFLAAGFKQWGAKIQEDVNEGVQWLIDQKIVDPQRIGIYGTGFGGYIALHNATSKSAIYRCAASNSGVLNLFSYLKSIPPFLKANLQMYYDIIGNPDTDEDYMRQASPVFHADKVTIPVFITQNEKDPRINPGDAIQFVKKLKKRNIPVIYMTREDSPQPLVRDENRQKIYAELEQFLAKNLKKK